MSHFLLKVQELFSRKWFIVLALVSLVGFQLLYSFLFPSCGSGGDIWEPITTFLPKFTAVSSDSFLLDKIYPLISPQYSLYTDASYFLELGKNFSPEHLDGHMYVERPLWPFLIFLPSIFTSFFITSSYALIFSLAISLNFILLSVGVLLFFSLLKQLFSLKVAWLSSILLIFSPFVHNYLNQPLSEILTVFTAILSIYLLYNYVKKPSVAKLIFFSLIVGVLMLGKALFAISIFILVLAIYFKRYKEGIAFLIIQLTPLLLWYLWVTQVWQISYWFYGAQKADVGFWMFNVFHWSWQETFQVLLNTSSNFFTALIFSFLLIPIIFSVIGWEKLPFKSKNIIYFGSIFSVFIFGFLTAYYAFRHVFLLFPIIYPTCILGIGVVSSRFKKHKTWLVPLFYVIIIGFIILISNINIHEVFPYNLDLRPA